MPKGLWFYLNLVGHVELKGATGTHQRVYVLSDLSGI